MIKKTQKGKTAQEGGHEFQALIQERLTELGGPPGLGAT